MELTRYEAGASAAVPTIPTAVAGNPSNGDLALSLPATTPGAFWFYQLQQEMHAVLAAGGIIPTTGDLTQLSTAINTLSGGAVFTVSGLGTVNGTIVTVPHSFPGFVPKLVWATLFCVTPELGYIAGEEVSIPPTFPDPTFPNVRYSLSADTTNVNLVIANSGQFIILRKDGVVGQSAFITPANWWINIRAKMF